MEKDIDIKVYVYDEEPRISTYQNIERGSMRPIDLPKDGPELRRFLKHTPIHFFMELKITIDMEIYIFRRPLTILGYENGLDRLMERLKEEIFNRFEFAKKIPPFKEEDLKI